MHMGDQNLLWIGCGGRSGETRALLGVEGRRRTCSTSSMSMGCGCCGIRLWLNRSWGLSMRELMEGREHLTVSCVEGSIALA